MTFDFNFNFEIKRDYQKKSYELCVYESVDNGERPILGYI